MSLCCISSNSPIAQDMAKNLGGGEREGRERERERERREGRSRERGGERGRADEIKHTREILVDVPHLSFLI